MKKFISLLFFAFFLLSCSDDNEPKVEPNVEEAPITVLAYLVAENNLDDELRTNIRTMFSGLSGLDKSATLLIYWDGKTSIAGNDMPVILRYEYDGKGKILHKHKRTFIHFETYRLLLQRYNRYKNRHNRRSRKLSCCIGKEKRNGTYQRCFKC